MIDDTGFPTNLNVAQSTTSLTLYAVLDSGVTLSSTDANAIFATVIFWVNVSDDVDDGTCDVTHCSFREAINGGHGLFIASSSSVRNAILTNAIFSNTGLGIDLLPDDANSNDAGDSDTGANNRQNFLILTAATSGSTALAGTLNSSPNTTFRLEFFANLACDPSGYGEGERFLDSMTVTTNSNGNASFTATVEDTVPPGQFITATATDPNGNTSEFSLCRPVTVAPSALEAPRNVRTRRIRQLVLLQWERADATAAFRIFRRLNGETDFSSIGQTRSEMFNDTLPHGTATAEYVVAAEDAMGGRAVSAVISVIIPTASYTPAVPHNLRARVMRGLVLLQWQGDQHTTTFHIFRRLETESDFTAIGHTTQPLFNDRLPQGTGAAEYTVMAENQFGMSAASNPITVLSL
jgi:hypothetical protein